MKVLTDPAPRLASVMPGGVREDVARIVDRALAFDRDARYPDALAMQADVRAARTTPNAKLAEPIAPQDDVATRSPKQLAESPPMPLSSQPTMMAAPESALVREARGTSPAVSVVTSPTRISGDVPPREEERKREIAGIPIWWLAVAGIVILFAAGVLATVVAFAVFGHRSDSPAPPSAATTTAAPTHTAAPAPPPSDEDDEPHHGHGPPPHGHPKHH